jgi:hypothetical protein
MSICTFVSSHVDADRTRRWQEQPEMRGAHASVLTVV